MRTADQIRSAFLRFFEGRGHRVVKSSSLVPECDPTLLFANAGMNQFKDVFLGRERREYVRAASSQKCVRAGGKHNDLENVGVTARHHTFFEMLGNFSFGDYFKTEAIGFAWELLTRDLGLPPDRMVVTVFEGDASVPADAEARRAWREHVPADRILGLGAKDNFWAMGDTGPCGPCSEIHFFQGGTLPCAEEREGRACRGVECECDRWIEVWNLVFMQYDRDTAGGLQPLPAPCVDTGMGLERIAAVLQGKLSNFETDLFTPLIDAVAERAGRDAGASAETDVSLRVVADHLRATTFLVSDGVLPGNEGRGYVLRKIMRRAIRHGRKLGIEEPFLFRLVGAVVDRMGPAYPELISHAESLARVVQVEEQRFATTLRQAISVFEEVASAARRNGSGQVDGASAFKLYDTYGLPLDFTEELASDLALGVDREGFERELQAQQDRARLASKMGPVAGDPVYVAIAHERRTEFLGYETLLAESSRVLAVLRDGAVVPQIDRGEEGVVVLDRTPFYAASGGQVGDRGTIEADGAVAEVLDCTAPVPGLHAHLVRVTAGSFQTDATVLARVDSRWRASVARHHTATHLLHAALRETLGPHVKQAGSLVAPDRLRFDFSHYAPVTPEELRHVESRVNAEVLRNASVEKQLMDREGALASGALAFFGEKYGERVRVVEVPGFSKELCGGTHVRRTGDIGLFLFTSEQGISAGTRRVEAVVGEAALACAQADRLTLDQLESLARADRRALPGEVSRLRDQIKALQREAAALKTRLATGASGEAGRGPVEVGSVQVWTPRFDGLDRKAHAAVVDEFRNRNRDRDFAIVSACVDDGSVHVIAAVSESLRSRIGAPEIMKRLGLRGGGRPDFAQGGGVTADDVEGLRARASALLGQLLGSSDAA
jgi:alanyl-tRNA synthetase